MGRVGIKDKRFTAQPQYQLLPTSSFAGCGEGRYLTNFARALQRSLARQRSCALAPISMGPMSESSPTVQGGLPFGKRQTCSPRRERCSFPDPYPFDSPHPHKKKNRGFRSVFSFCAGREPASAHLRIFLRFARNIRGDSCPGSPTLRCAARERGCPAPPFDPPYPIKDKQK
jgi:hypothetical protein